MNPEVFSLICLAVAVIAVAPVLVRRRTWSAIPGQKIGDACRELVDMSQRQWCTTTADFNDVQITARPWSISSRLVRKWRRETDRKEAAYKKSAEYVARRQEAEEHEARHRADLAKAMSSAPVEPNMIRSSAWNKYVEANQDPYGAACVRYAERWASLVERAVDNGERLEDVAEDLSHLADEEGITGFMHGAAVSMLAECWIHGESLRRWHNLKYQLAGEGDKANDSGGILNPAVLSMGAADA